MSNASAARSVLTHPRFIPVVIGLGLLIRLAVAMLFPLEQMSDSAWYVSRAQEMVAGLGYQEGGYPTAYWPVGWPALIASVYAVLGSMPITIWALNLSGAFVSMLAIVGLGRNIAGDETVARLALLAYAIYPNHIAYTGVAATETVYTAIILLAFALLCERRTQWGKLVVCGLLFGGATLIKPQTLAFPFGVVIMLSLLRPRLDWKAALQRGLIVYVMLFAVVLPWSMRNQAVFGEFVLVSTNGGTALLIGANDQVTGDHFDYEGTEVFRQFGIPLKERVARQIELDKLQKDAAKRWIADHPWEYVSWMPRKVALLWMKDTDGFWTIDYNYPDDSNLIRALQWANQVYYLFIMGASVVCLCLVVRNFLGGKADGQRMGLLFAMPIFLSLLAAVFTGQIRYHYPAMPFLFVAAAWLTVAVYRKHVIGESSETGAACRVSP